MNSSQVLKTAAFLGAVTVIIGAFGAHGLKPKLTEYQIAIFEKGVQYQFIHVLALLAVGILMKIFPENHKNLQKAAVCFLIGILFFSGSLYLLATRDLLPFSVALAGPATPFGGVFFIFGWIFLAFSRR